MAVNKVTINVKKDFKNLDNLIEKVKSTDKILGKLGNEMVASTNENFNKNKDPDDDKWQELSKGTRKRRKTISSRTSSKILFDTGTLRSSLKKYKTKNKEVSLSPELNSEDMLYAKRMNSSIFSKSKNPLLKPRKFLGISEKTKNIYIDIVKKYIYNKK